MEDKLSTYKVQCHSLNISPLNLTTKQLVKFINFVLTVYDYCFKEKHFSFIIFVIISNNKVFKTYIGH